MTLPTGWRLVPGNKQPDEGRTWRFAAVAPQGLLLEAYVYEMLPFFRADKQTVISGVARVFWNGGILVWELPESSETADAGIVAMMAATEAAQAKLIELAKETP